MKALLGILVCAALFIPLTARAQSWQQVGPDGGFVKDMAWSGNEIITVNEGGRIFQSPDAGATWHEIYSDPSQTFRSVAARGNTIIAGTEFGILRSTDGGETFQPVGNTISNRAVDDLYFAADQKLFASTNGGGLHSSSNDGTTFTSVAGLPASYPLFVTQGPTGTYFCGVQFSSVNLYASVDGITWTPRDTGIDADASDVVFDPSDPSGNTAYAVGGNKVFRTTNAGTVWTSLGAPPTYFYGSAASLPTGELVVSAAGPFPSAGIVLSTINGGATWTQDTGLPGQGAGQLLNTPVGLFLPLDGPGPYQRTSTGSNWVSRAFGMNNQFVRALAVNEAIGVVYAAILGLGIYKSTDAGVNWQISSVGIPSHELINALITTSQNYAFASGAYGGIYRTINGTDWSKVFPAPATALATNDQGHLFGGLGGRVYRSTNEGVGWAQVALLPGVTEIRAIACDGDYVYVATDNGIFTSENNGITWFTLSSGLTTLNVTSITVDQNWPSTCTVIAGTSLGVFTLNPVAEYWVYRPEYGSEQVERVKHFENEVFVVRRTSCRRMRRLAGCPSDLLSAPAPEMNDVVPVEFFASAAAGQPEPIRLVGTLGYGLWRGVGDGQSAVPPGAGMTTALRSAYPNPFNPRTTVSFELTVPGEAQLEVFDLHGTRVRTLASGRHEAGRHEVAWDGRDGAGAGLASGVYLLRLSTGDRSEVRKVILAK